MSENLPVKRYSHVLASLALSRECEECRPRPGTELVGTIVGDRMRDGPYGSGRQVLIRTEKGNVVAVWLTAFLENELRIQEAETGDIVAIWSLRIPPLSSISRSGARIPGHTSPGARPALFRQHVYARDCEPKNTKYG